LRFCLASFVDVSFRYDMSLSSEVRESVIQAKAVTPICTSRMRTCWSYFWDSQRLQQQVGRFCTASRAGVASLPGLAAVLFPRNGSALCLTGQDSREECRPLRILRMKELRAWLLENPAPFWCPGGSDRPQRSGVRLHTQQSAKPCSCELHGEAHIVPRYREVCVPGRDAS